MSAPTPVKALTDVETEYHFRPRQIAFLPEFLKEKAPFICQIYSVDLRVYYNSVQQKLYYFLKAPFLSLSKLSHGAPF